MTASPGRILATHVGSLVRPPELVAHLRGIEAGEPYDEAEYGACLTRSIDETVARQVASGIDIVSDGEFGKGKNWAFYVHDRLTGIDRRPLTAKEAEDPANLFAMGGRDREAFPEFYDEYDTVTGMKARMSFRIVCTGAIRYVGQQAIQRDIANLKSA